MYIHVSQQQNVLQLLWQRVGVASYKLHGLMKE